MEDYRVDEEILEQMIDSIDLLDYIGESCEVHRINDDSYAVSCPLHVDKTPSLKITPSLNMFHCFSCGFSGTILQWMVKVEGLSYRKAIEKLSSMSGIDTTAHKRSRSLKFFKELKNMREIGRCEIDKRKLLLPDEINKYKKEYPPELFIRFGTASGISSR